MGGVGGRVRNGCSVNTADQWLAYLSGWGGGGNDTNADSPGVE